MSNSKLPNIKDMEENYDRYYLVPFPDCQKFEELDPNYVNIIPAYEDGLPICFVNAWWLDDDCENDED